MVNIKSIIAEFEKYTVFGSGVLAVRGIRQAKDVDLVVTENLFQDLLSRGWVKDKNNPRSISHPEYDIEAQVGVLLGDGDFYDSEGLISRSDCIDGVHYVCLKDLREIKTKFGREKDLRDIVLIDEYQKKNFGN